MKHRKTILLADNSAEFRWLMWKIAKEHGYFAMMTVGNGRDVLLSMQKQVPDILLMDIALPDICGLTVLEELRQQNCASKTIILSSIVSEHVARKALALGALYFVPKPFHAKALFDMMHRLMHNHPQYPPLPLVTTTCFHPSACMLLINTCHFYITTAYLAKACMTFCKIQGYRAHISYCSKSVFAGDNDTSLPYT